MRQIIKTRRTKRHRPIAAWLGILALALAMLAPVAQGIPLSGASNDAQAPFYMVLCKTMQKGASEPSPEQDPNASDCPVCLGLSFGNSVLLTALAETPVCDIQPRAFIINMANETGDGRALSHAHARAPPLTV